MTTPFDPLRSEHPMIVYIDFKSPYAYLAKDPAYAIEDELGIEIDWRPLTLDIPSYLGSARLDTQGKVVEKIRKNSYNDITFPVETELGTQGGGQVDENKQNNGITFDEVP